ncbi:hypothetical protein RHGRI_035224 [Rhododendron griersonianum]|uniref:Uncharacterized protein n=1 Tax=Rhododendron griersonianum TaxID=479676 RepID=A0AAV6I3Q4_9ERIC|nr:hypothetical protein RHGRI_035224 [Rhododendron griersonianum]
MYRFLCPERPDLNTTNFPSGEHDGNALLPVSSLVRSLISTGIGISSSSLLRSSRFARSNEIRAIWTVALTGAKMGPSDVNITFFSAGDQEVHLFEPSDLTILRPHFDSKSGANAIRSPSGENDGNRPLSLNIWIPFTGDATTSKCGIIESPPSAADSPRNL